MEPNREQSEVAQTKPKPFEFEKMYPRVKVRVQEEEEEEEDHYPLFLRLIGSLSKQEKENKIISPPSDSIPRVTKAHLTSPTPKSLSATKVKNDKQVGRNMKANVKTASILPPRAVLSSPDNDGVIGNINKLDYEASWASKKRPVDIVNQSRNVTPSSPSIGKVPTAKTEHVNHSPIIARCSPKIIGKGSKIEI
ncbi:hypothetical protein HRI_005186300 [Hibiscus trionum]|uniref:Uncharacterized protein n=1 Tax=Hibiscus trionum TaxID=183268 RepID=A0A9W7JGN2_HIBTR|nr:hypothetical protein HRI_005186300 [Hibiscus trionum]